MILVVLAMGSRRLLLFSYKTAPLLPSIKQAALAYVCGGEPAPSPKSGTVTETGSTDGTAVLRFAERPTAATQQNKATQAAKQRKNPGEAGFLRVRHIGADGKRTSFIDIRPFESKNTALSAAACRRKTS